MSPLVHRASAFLSSS